VERDWGVAVAVSAFGFHRSCDFLCAFRMTLPLIRLENVDVALNGQTVLSGLTWRLQRGEHWAVLGGNGSGKSTFLKLVRGELWPAPGRGQRLFALEGAPQDSAVGVQEAMPLVSPEYQERCQRLDWARTVGQVVASGLSGGDVHAARLTASERERAQSAADLLGLHRWWNRDVRELSTGEWRRTLLARALASSPQVLVCDEVCDGLDAASRATLLQALERIARAGTQLLITTHRAEELIPALTHRLVLQKGRIVEQGAWRSPPDDAPARTGGPLGSPTVTLPARGRALISMERASVYLGSRRVLREVTWQLQAGEHWWIQGPNGSGKSTLLKLMGGELHPALGGRIRRFDFTAANTLWELRHRIGSVSPELQANYRERLTGAEVIATGYLSTIGFIERPSGRRVRRAAALADELGFAELADKSVLEMSYGEFRKILLARALVHNPALLLFDEPFDGLDAGARGAIANVLAKAAGRGASLIIVTHHEADLPGWMTHRARLEAGRLVEQGPWVRTANPLEADCKAPT